MEKMNELKPLPATKEQILEVFKSLLEWASSWQIPFTVDVKPQKKK